MSILLQPILKEILEEKRPCERHTIFTTGKSKAKNALKHQSGFGPISDPDLVSVEFMKL